MPCLCDLRLRDKPCLCSKSKTAQLWERLDMPIAYNSNEVTVYGGSTLTIQQLFDSPENAPVGDVGVFMRRQVDVLGTVAGAVRYIYVIPARTLTIDASKVEVINAHLLMARNRSTSKTNAIGLVHGGEFVLGRRVSFGMGGTLESYDPRSVLTISDQGAPWEGAGGHGIYCASSKLRLNGVFNPAGFYGFYAQSSVLELNCAVFGYGRENFGQQQFIADAACTISGEYFYLKSLAGYASPRLLSWASLPNNTVLQDCKVFECSNTDSYFERFGWNHPEFECIHGSINFSNIYTATFKNPVRKYDKFKFRNYANKNYGEAVISLDVSLQVQDTIYNPVPAAIYARDRNHGVRKGAYVVDQIYTAEANSAGAAALSDVLASYWLMTSAEYQANPNLQVPMDVRLPLDVWAYDYGHNILSTFVDQRDGVAEIEATLTLVPDQNVSKSKATAAALIQSETLDDFYDLSKLWKCQPLQSRMEYPSLTGLLVMARGNELDMGALNLVVDGTASEVISVNTETDTVTLKATMLTAGQKFKSVKTTGTITVVSGAGISAAVEDANGVRITVRKSGGGDFNIAARKGTTGAYTDLGFQSDVSSVTYTVAKGTPVEVVMWSLGCVTYTRTISTTAGGVVLDVEMTVNSSINTALDVSSYLANISLSLDTSGATPFFVITFNAAMTVIGIELGKALVHRLVGQEVALRSGFPPGSASTIVINADEITNQLPAVRLDIGASISVEGRVYLDFFINTLAAQTVNPAYVINPPRADGNQVQILRAKPALDASQLSAAVWSASQRTLTSVSAAARPSIDF